MLLKYFYDEKLAHASYVVGCQATGEALIVDPMRNITPYINLAKQEGLTITGVAETHIHADFVSGSRELASRLGAKLYLSDEGDENWKYQNLDGYTYELLKDGDQFKVGNLVLDVKHTPGHTPESLSFLLTDRGGNADKPMGIFTGDFVFVGDIGRPDLLEKAAGISGTAEAGAIDMFHSVQKFKTLPDYLQVWPAHGAGSACGKSLGAIPTSTVGYEKQFNWAMLIDDQEKFIKTLLDGQPEPPTYFAVMKHVNKVGPNLLNDLPELKQIQTLDELKNLISEGHQVVDTRPYNDFSEGYISGTINVPFNKSFANWMGWLVDYNRPLYLLADIEELEEMKITLRSVGIDNVSGYGEADIMIKESPTLETMENVTPEQVKQSIANREVNVLDVRNLSELASGRIASADHIMLGHLPQRLNDVNADQPVVVHCASGVRSAIAASFLKANGIKNVINLLGGYSRWEKEVKNG